MSNSYCHLSSNFVVLAAAAVYYFAIREHNAACCCAGFLLPSTIRHCHHVGGGSRNKKLASSSCLVTTPTTTMMKDDGIGRRRHPSGGGGGKRRVGDNNNVDGLFSAVGSSLNFVSNLEEEGNNNNPNRMKKEQQETERRFSKRAWVLNKIGIRSSRKEMVVVNESTTEEQQQQTTEQQRPSSSSSSSSPSPSCDGDDDSGSNNNDNNNNKKQQQKGEEKIVEVKTVKELDDYFADREGKFRRRRKKKKSRGTRTTNAAVDATTTTDDDDDGGGIASETTEEEEEVNDDDTDTEKDWRDTDYDTLLDNLSVIGDTQIIGSPNHPNRVHPVLQLLHERRKNNSQLSSTTRPDGCKVALSIEGGGMRGCVSAGMVAAIHYLGLDETFDVVYGSSAGAVIGSYFITRQLPWFGPEIYYDSLTTAGSSFIDTRRLLRALGLGLLDPRLVKDVFFRPSHGKPILNLSFLLKKTAQDKKPLNWDKFCDMQKVQPLKIVASGLRSEKAIVMDMERGSFSGMGSLADCMHASCLLPGIAGPIMNMNLCETTTTTTTTTDDDIGNEGDDDGKDGGGDTTTSNNTQKKRKKQELKLGSYREEENCEPLADALLYEPLPYRSAIADNCTHIVVLRTRPDGVDVTGRSSFLERMIMRRFFLRKNKLPNMYKRVRMQLHKKLYGEDVLVLNEAAMDTSEYLDLSKPHIMPIAMGPGTPEVTKLETSRIAIFEGVRRGFARAYDALVEDPAERGRGSIVAKQYFPDEILDYDPLEIDERYESAFDAYIKQRKKEDGNDWNFPKSLGKTAGEVGAPW